MQGWRWFLAVALVIGCSGSEGDEGETGDTAPPPAGDTETAGDTAVEDVDEDGDGFLASVDCNDEDPAVNPDALEICDGVDNDCDEQVDDTAAATVGGVNFELLDAAVLQAQAAKEPVTLALCPAAPDEPHDLPPLEVEAEQDITVWGPGEERIRVTSREGDTVFVVSGTGRLVLQGLTVSGATRGRAAVRANGEATLEVIDTEIGENRGPGIVVQGTGDGVTLEITGSRIANNVIDDTNQSPDDSGAGLRLLGVYDATLTDSEVSQNSTPGEGGGLYLGGPTAVTLVDTTIDSNSASDGGGFFVLDAGGIAEGSDEVLLSANEVDRGGGVFVGASSEQQPELLLENLTFKINEAQFGGAIFVASNRTVKLLDSVVLFSNRIEVPGKATPPANGAGAYLTGVNATLVSDGALWVEPGAETGGENEPDDVAIGKDVSVDFDREPVTLTCSTNTNQCK